ncbi:MAG: hypothetical protein AAB935_01480 [Patescibacteria group bacterium]
MKKVFIFVFLVVSVFIALKASASSLPQAINDLLNNVKNTNIGDGDTSNLKDVIEQITRILSKIAEPVRVIIKALGNFFIWILELIIKLIRAGTAYL